MNSVATLSLIGVQAWPQHATRYWRGTQKIPELLAALDGHRMSEHHRQLIRYSIEHLAFLGDQVTKIDKEIRRSKILEAAGEDMRVFPSDRHLSSWGRHLPW